MNALFGRQTNNRGWDSFWPAIFENISTENEPVTMIHTKKNCQNQMCFEFVMRNIENPWHCHVDQPKIMLKQMVAVQVHLKTFSSEYVKLWSSNSCLVVDVFGCGAENVNVCLRKHGLQGSTEQGQTNYQDISVLLKTQNVSNHYRFNSGRHQTCKNIWKLHNYKVPGIPNHPSYNLTFHDFCKVGKVYWEILRLSLVDIHCFQQDNEQFNIKHVSIKTTMYECSSLHFLTTESSPRTRKKKLTFSTSHTISQDTLSKNKHM